MMCVRRTRMMAALLLATCTGCLVRQEPPPPLSPRFLLAPLLTLRRPPWPACHLGLHRRCSTPPPPRTIQTAASGYLAPCNTFTARCISGRSRPRTRRGRPGAWPGIHGGGFSPPPSSCFRFELLQRPTEPPQARNGERHCQEGDGEGPTEPGRQGQPKDVGVGADAAELISAETKVGEIGGDDDATWNDMMREARRAGHNLRLADRGDVKELGRLQDLFRRSLLDAQDSPDSAPVQDSLLEEMHQAVLQNTCRPPHILVLSDAHSARGAAAAEGAALSGGEAIRDERGDGKVCSSLKGYIYR